MPDPITNHEVMLKASALTKRFDGPVVLNSVDLELRKGQVVLLRGENGSGKTTLLNILSGALDADSGTIEYSTSGGSRTFTFPRTWWQRLSLSDHFAPEYLTREGVARTWQHTRLFASQSLSDNIALGYPKQAGEGPLSALVSPWTWLRSEETVQGGARRTLRRLGLINRYGSSADQISLGQAKRVAIARTVASGAELLLLDEPLSGLDHQGASDIVSLLGALVKDHGRTLVLVEHVLNQERLLPLITTDWLIEDGKVLVTDLQDDQSTSSAIDAPSWLNAIKAQAIEVQEVPLPRGALLTRIRKPGTLPSPAGTLLEIRTLVARRGKRTIVGLDDNDQVRGLDLEIRDGEIAVLQAPNGWGKTTLTEVVAGLHPVESGEIVLNGRCLQTLPAWERARLGVSTLPSNSKLFPSFTVSDLFRLSNTTTVPDDCGALLYRKCSTLSGGERQNVALESTRHALVSIYDEPFLGLDVARITKTLTRFMAEAHGCQLLLVPRAL